MPASRLLALLLCGPVPACGGVTAALTCGENNDCPAGATCLEQVCVAVDAGAVPPAGAPLVGADLALTVDEDASASVALSASGGDGSTVLFVLLDAPAHGAVDITAERATYTPEPDSDVGDTFTYVPIEGDVAGSPGTVDVTVTPAADPPRIAFGAAFARVYLDAATPVNVVVTDPDSGDTATIVAASTTSAALVTPGAGGFTYTSRGVEGFDAVLVTARDSGGLESTATIPLVVEGPQRDCFRIFARGLSVGTATYTLVEDPSFTSPAPQRYQALCDMSATAPGFTLAMRGNPNDGNLSFNGGFIACSRCDVNATSFDLNDGQSAAYRSISSAPAREVMIAFRHGGAFDRRAIVEHPNGFGSFKALVAGGNDVAAVSGPSRTEWLALLDGSDLQDNCNFVGFNPTGGQGARVGIVGNDQADCNGTDSYIGFGGTDGAALIGDRDRSDPSGDVTVAEAGALFVRNRDLTFLGDHATCAQFAAEGWTSLGGLADVLVGGAVTRCP